MLWQPTLAESYVKASPGELAVRIAARKRELGERLLILGHHYQVDEVIRHADITGDSLKLSQAAAERCRDGGVRWVVFCGVHFMAETADMLTPESVKVILPDLSAGCSMADMAHHDDAVDAWDRLHESLKDQGWSGKIVPITYVNSTAAVKAFVGERGGACCTSSNADAAFAWALSRGKDVKVLFLPDQHLGRNTAAARGIDVERRSCVYDPRLARKGEPLGGATARQVLDAGVVLWAGHCSVHKLFRPEHCDQVRADDAAHPERARTTILVHPECCKEVVDRADLSGSTEFIIRSVRGAAPGSRWAIGTEHNLVARLARESAARGVSVRILSDCQCLCTTMYRIDQPHLCWVLDHLAGAFSRDGSPREVNVIRVHPEARRLALIALERMLALTASAPRAAPALTD
ncbi:MAG: quinolinate synthase NadA [Phycisphaerae bacterium]|nr:quinolinate synthase NadA [Phycisphaerae bacterium]